MTRRRLVSIGHVLTLLAACAPAASFDGTLFRGHDVSFRVATVPPTWRRVSLPYADLAFRDDARDASILLNSRCSPSDRDAPLVALTDHLILGTTARRVTREETVPFDGREAQHTLLEARLDGVPMAYDIYVLKKDGCVFDLVYVTPPPAAPDGVATSGAVEFERFVSGFHTVPSSG